MAGVLNLGIRLRISDEGFMRLGSQRVLPLCLGRDLGCGIAAALLGDVAFWFFDQLMISTKDRLVFARVISLTTRCSLYHSNIGTLMIGLRIWGILYYTILYYTIPYHTIPYHTIPYHTILHYTIQYYTLLYFTILYYTKLRNPKIVVANVSASKYETCLGHSSQTV